LFPLLAVSILFAKILIISQEVNPDEVVGMGAGFIIWCGLLHLRVRGRTLLVVVSLLVYVALWRLEPFQFGDTARPFGWIPFYSLLHGSLEVNTESYLEKVFYYGSLIWLMAEAGLPIFVTGIAVAALLFATSSAEIYLPVRSAEITDALLALIIAGLASLLVSKQLTRGKVNANVATVRVVMAARDLEVGVKLAEEDLRLADWAVGTPPKECFLNLKDAVGRAVLYPTFKDEIILGSRLASVGAGVAEIRVRSAVEHRIFYVARFEEAIYVLHAFEKRTRRTRQADLKLARRRLADLLRSRRDK